MTDKTDYWVIPTELAVQHLDETDLEQLEKIAHKLAKATQHDYEGAVVIATDDPRFSDVKEYIERRDQLVCGVDEPAEDFGLIPGHLAADPNQPITLTFNGNIESVYITNNAGYGWEND